MIFCVLFLSSNPQFLLLWLADKRSLSASYLSSTATMLTRINSQKSQTSTRRPLSLLQQYDAIPSSSNSAESPSCDSSLELLRTRVFNTPLGTQERDEYAAKLTDHLKRRISAYKNAAEYAEARGVMLPDTWRELTSDELAFMERYHEFFKQYCVVDEGAGDGGNDDDSGTLPWVVPAHLLVRAFYEKGKMPPVKEGVFKIVYEDYWKLGARRQWDTLLGRVRSKGGERKSI